jgi:hypothetical protein
VPGLLVFGAAVVAASFLLAWAAEAARVASRRSGRTVRALVLDSGYRVELGFLLVASLVAFAVPLSGQISLILGLALFALQYAVPWQAGRYVLIAVYLVAGLAALARNRRCILPTLAAPLRRSRDSGTAVTTPGATAEPYGGAPEGQDQEYGGQGDAGERLSGSGTRAASSPGC